MEKFDLNNIDFNSKNSEKFYHLLDDKKNFYEFTTSTKEKINLKFIKLKKHPVVDNGGDDNDRFCRDVDIIVLCKENNIEYVSSYLLISASRNFIAFEYYNSSITFTKK